MRWLFLCVGAACKVETGASCRFGQDTEVCKDAMVESRPFRQADVESKDATGEWLQSRRVVEVCKDAMGEWSRYVLANELWRTTEVGCGTSDPQRR